MRVRRLRAADGKNNGERCETGDRLMTRTRTLSLAAEGLNELRYEGGKCGEDTSKKGQ